MSDADDVKTSLPFEESERCAKVERSRTLIDDFEAALAAEGFTLVALFVDDGSRKCAYWQNDTPLKAKLRTLVSLIHNLHESLTEVSKP